MKLEDYKKELADIEKRAKDEKTDLAKKYALSNNKVSIGDIITDGNTIIKVDKFTFYYDTNNPSLICHGQLYTKKLVPFKGDKRDSIYQINLKKM